MRFGRFPHQTMPRHRGNGDPIMRSFLLSITPLVVALAAMGIATAAYAAQDTPFTSNGVTAVCTGVGSAKDNPEWSSYPIKLVLANSAGENLADAHFSISRNGA